MKRLTLAFLAVSVLVGLSVSTALAQWPTSCVELNDVIEASLGNDENVGIYERVHGDQAEAVCQSEHRDSGFQFGVRPYQLPSKSDPTAYTQAFVERAIHRYNTEGLQATLDYYNSPQSVDGQWYVFIIDENQTIIAHAADPDLVGKHVSQALGPNSYPTGSAVAASADEDGAWFDYTYANPASGVVETKHSWVVIHDGITFGSGWYERGPGKSDAPAYTKAFVQQAMNLYVALGLEETVAYYNAKESVDGQWYVFIIDRPSSLTPPAGKHVSQALGPNSYPTGSAVAASTAPGSTTPTPIQPLALWRPSNPRRHYVRLRLVRTRPRQVRRPRLHQGLRAAGHEPLRRPRPGGDRRLLQHGRERRRPVVRLHHRPRRLHDSPP